jgi:crossover junction endodeoxyribonuclease RusA
MTGERLVWLIEVPPPLRRKPWISSNDHEHWGRRHQLTLYWRDFACAAAIRQGIPRLDVVQVSARLSFGDGRRRDAHNYWPTVKACVDGLVDAGALIDDSDRYIKSSTIARDESCPRGVSLIIYKTGDDVEDLGGAAIPSLRQGGGVGGLVPLRHRNIGGLPAEFAGAGVWPQAGRAAA